MSSARSGPSRAGSGRRRRDPRRSAARIAAPAALLLGITVAALLVRAGISGSDPARPVATQPPAATTTTAPATTAETEPTQTSTETTGGVTFYEIESGDTLESIAADHGTTVEVLLELNPEVDPVALTVGQRIRVS